MTVFCCSFPMVCVYAVFRLCTIQSDNMVMKTEHAQTLSQLTAQNEALRNNFRDQVRNLQEEHRKTVETLQQQLSRVEAQLFQLKSETSTRGNFQSQYQVFLGQVQICVPESESKTMFIVCGSIIHQKPYLENLQHVLSIH